jgi:hypothetical protein
MRSSKIKNTTGYNGGGMFRDIFTYIFGRYSDLGDRFLGSVAALLMLALIYMLGTVTYCLVDTVGISATRTCQTALTKKETIPAHTTTVLVQTGKVLMPFSTHHSESYLLHFKINEAETTKEVDGSFYNAVKTGAVLEVYYGVTRISNSYKAVKIRLVQH